MSEEGAAGQSADDWNHGSDGQRESEMISERTRAALAAVKRQGAKLVGFPGVRFTAKHVKAAVAARQDKAAQRAADLAPIVKDLQASGCESLAIAAGLDERGIPAARSGRHPFRRKRTPRRKRRRDVRRKPT
jgi:hypothetical protein